MWVDKSILQGVHVLVADGNETSREVLEVLLDHYGAVVRAVGSVAEALSAIGQELPDVLVSEIRMPDQDGYTLMRKVRALSAGQGGRIPALAFTGLNRSEDRELAIAAGFQTCLSKPAELSELVWLVARLSEIGTAGYTV